MFDYFEDTDNFYIVMERPEKYIDLFDYITQKGTVSERSSRYLFRQVVEAVQYCLSVGVVHRDVKDENILIDLKHNQIKLIDFGSGTFMHDGMYTEYEGEYSRVWLLDCYKQCVCIHYILHSGPQAFYTSLSAYRKWICICHLGTSTNCDLYFGRYSSVLSP